MPLPILKKYPSIEQFRNVIRNVTQKTRYRGLDEKGNAIYNYAAPLPVLTFRGTVKLHGTNAGVGFLFNATGVYWCQSRERIITPDDDNASFASHVRDTQEVFEGYAECIKDFIGQDPAAFSKYHGAVIYGEWCGGNIQKGVAINQLPKMFIVFGVRVFGNDPEDYVWLAKEHIQTLIPKDPDSKVYTVFDFENWTLDIDFNAPELSQNKLRDITEYVETCCPVAKYFGVDGTGEGVVWECISPPYTGGDFMFKVKGEKHTVTRVKTLAAIDVEKVSSIAACVDTILTENRLLQGVEYLKEQRLEVGTKNMGPFLKWVANDCLKEELDTITASNLEPKEVCKQISNRARQWFFEYLGNN